MTHPGSQNEAKMRLRRLPWAAIGGLWGGPVGSLGAPWRAQEGLLAALWGLLGV